MATAPTVCPRLPTGTPPIHLLGHLKVSATYGVGDPGYCVTDLENNKVRSGFTVPVGVLM